MSWTLPTLWVEAHVMLTIAIAAMTSSAVSISSSVIVSHEVGGGLGGGLGGGEGGGLEPDAPTSRQARHALSAMRRARPRFGERGNWMDWALAQFGELGDRIK
ncbi:hypothetical protein T492DRAFT_868532 [Pavlovales sp. CCMP2436]|nr:hypothetical protein T492DRAFT_868532 [Pavlovales sp. CCMP2436]